MSMTNLQIELLKTFSFELSESQLQEIKKLLARYFAEKSTSEMEEFCAENNWDEQTLEALAEDHLRTSYE